MLLLFSLCIYLSSPVRAAQWFLNVTLFIYFLSSLFCVYIYQFSSVAQLCLTLCNPMNRSTPGLPVHHQLLEFTQTHVHQVSDAIQPSHPLLSPSPPVPNPSQHRVFSSDSTLRMRWPKYWSFSFSISPSNEHPGLVSFKMDWLGLLALQGNLKSLLQHHSSKTSILWCSAFQQHKRRLYTRTSPDGQHRNQIDYILCSKRWRSSIQ